MNIIPVRGFFRNTSGFFKFDKQYNKLTNIKIYFPMKSLTTNNSKRDFHLKSKKFLNISRFPFAKLSINKLNLSPGEEVQTSALLEIKEIQKEVPIEIKFLKIAKDPWDKSKESLFFTFNSKIFRKNFDLDWSKTTELGEHVIGEEISIFGSIEANRTDTKLAFSRFFYNKNFKKDSNSNESARKKALSQPKECVPEKIYIEKKVLCPEQLPVAKKSTFAFSDYLVSFFIFLSTTLLTLFGKYHLSIYLKKYFKKEKFIDVITDLAAMIFLIYVLAYFMPLTGYR